MRRLEFATALDQLLTSFEAPDDGVKGSRGNVELLGGLSDGQPRTPRDKRCQRLIVFSGASRSRQAGSRGRVDKGLVAVALRTARSEQPRCGARRSSDESRGARNERRHNDQDVRKHGNGWPSLLAGWGAELTRAVPRSQGVRRARAALRGFSHPSGAAVGRWPRAGWSPEPKELDLVKDADREIERYLFLLFGRARASTLIELRWRAAAGMYRRFVNANDLQTVAREARRKAENTDVFVGVLPRWQTRGDRRAVAGDARAVWVDLDAVEAAGALALVQPVPHFIVASGGPGHVHAYWSLASPAAPAQVERANRRLAWAVGGDLQCTDAPRILRPPGTLHHGRGGLPVRLVSESCGPPVPLAALVGGLPDPPARRPQTSRSSGHGRPVLDPLLAVAPERYVRVLTGQSVGRDRKVRCPLHSDRTPSLHVYEDPADGWYCFGCGCGGSVYDLAAGVWGISPRGDKFAVLRAGLQHKLGLS